MDVKATTFSPAQNASVEPEFVSEPSVKQPTLIGLGNKQFSVAMQESKLDYSDVLVHCVKMSVQEFKKKHK